MAIIDPLDSNRVGESSNLPVFRMKSFKIHIHQMYTHGEEALVEKISKGEEIHSMRPPGKLIVLFAQRRTCEIAWEIRRLHPRIFCKEKIQLIGLLLINCLIIARQQSSGRLSAKPMGSPHL